MPRYSAETKAQMVNLYRNGSTITAISQAFGCSVSGATNILVAAGVHQRQVITFAATTENDRVVEMFQAGVSVAQIAQQLDRAPSGIAAKLVRSGIHVRAKRAVVDDATKAKLAEMYLDGYGLKFICEELDVDRSYAHDLLKAAGVQTDGRRANAKGLRHSCNESAFSLSESGEYTAEQKYWAGVLFADGSIRYCKNGSAVLKLAMIDLEHIEKFRQFLGWTGSINLQQPRKIKGQKGQVYESQPTHSIQVTGKKWKNDLAVFGIVPRKTYEQFFPGFLALDRDFWRGVVDGDGYVHDSGRGSVTVGVCGTIATSEAFSSLVFKLTGFAPKVEQRITCANWDGFARVKINGERARIVLKWLYENAEVFLDRKMQKYLEWR